MQRDIASFLNFYYRKRYKDASPWETKSALAGSRRASERSCAEFRASEKFGSLDNEACAKQGRSTRKCEKHFLRSI